jgi:hypothetical protein
LTLVEDSSPVWEVLVDEFNEYFGFVLNSFSFENFSKSSEETVGNFWSLFSFDSELNDGTTGMEGFEDFVFVVAGKDKSAVTSKLLNKRP